VAGSSNVVHKRTLGRFFDGTAWLGQIVMFVVLGLLVFPSRLLPMAISGLILSAFLILVARPASVFLSLALARLGIGEKAFISWVGLRGAVPIVLAIFPLLAGVPHAETLFNLTFFLVFTSTALQGWTLPVFARWLKVLTPEEGTRRKSPLELAPVHDADAELVEFMLPFRSKLAGLSVVELRLPEDAMVVLICRGDEFLVPSGATVLEEGDTIQVLVGKDNMSRVKQILSQVREGDAPL
jgi:cell volume regulation protein A